ncbi:helix-turn-helix transcriptional regulator [Actinoplanes sp. NPDC051411]|uniref:helix-turn-helix domain-containing protein n=1 Tax=Actinoplanes sp. NPDC051411 TaxID=3155522 RepID=UPI003429EF8E
MTRADPGDEAVTPVGVVLGRMRRAARLTGQQLGHMVGMSQAKISRIETGQTSASPADVARLAHALGASAEIVEELATEAERKHFPMTDWRPAPGAAGHSQEDIGALESSASEIRIFQPALVVGLAQTAGYARAVLAAMRELTPPPEFVDPHPSLAMAVTARVRRQEIVARSDHRFRFIMGEAALSSRLASAPEMLVQIDAIGKLAGAANVDVRFIPYDTVLPFPLIHGFELLDDACVIVDVFNTGLIGRGAPDLATYRRIFDRLEAVAVSDIEPLLKKYRDVYLRELTRNAGAPS